MKMRVMWAAMLLFTITSLQAQENVLTLDNTTTEMDSLQIQQASELLRSEGKNGELVLAIGGQQITLGKATNSSNVAVNASERAASRHQFSFGIMAFEFGYSLLPDLSYEGYSPMEEGFMDLRTGNSGHLGWRVLDMEFFLNRSQNLSLVTGFNWSNDFYRFHNEWSIEKVGDRIEPVAMVDKKKSKLITTQLGIPLGLKYRPARQVELTAFLFGEVVVNAHTMVKKPKEQVDMRGLNTLRYGVQATATYHNIGFYVKYTCTPLFRPNIGPKCHPLSIGLAWGF